MTQPLNMQLSVAIARINETMEEADPENVDRVLMSYLAESLFDDEDTAGALEWATGFADYLAAA